MLQTVGVDSAAAPNEVMAGEVAAPRGLLYCLLVCTLVSEERAALSVVSSGGFLLSAEPVGPPAHVTSSVQ